MQPADEDPVSDVGGSDKLMSGSGAATGVDESRFVTPGDVERVSIRYSVERRERSAKPSPRLVE